MNLLRDPENAATTRLRLWGDFAMFAMLVMEAFWITDWYDVLARPKAGWVKIDVYLLGVLLLTHVLARVIGRFQLRLLWRRLIIIFWLVIVVLAGFPLLTYAGESLTFQQMATHVVQAFLSIETDLNEFWHILLVFLVVLHAVSLARDSLQTYLPQANFQLGLLMLLLYGLLFSWNAPSQALLTTYGFLFSAIAAMSAARISTLSELRGGRLPPLQFPWLIGILTIASLVVGAAVLIGWFATHIASVAISTVLLVLFTVLMVLGIVVLSPVILLILALGPNLRDLLTALSKITFLSELLKFMENSAQRIGISPQLLQGVTRASRPVLLLGVLAGILALILIAAVWKPWQRQLLREDVTSTLPLRAALRFPRLLFHRLSGKLPSGGRALAAARIRWVYAQLMTLCSRLGKPRPEAATPLEFLPTVQNLFPDETATLQTITQAYLKVRYGELPETYEEVQAVLLGWDRLKAQGKTLRAAYKKSARLK